MAAGLGLIGLAFAGPASADTNIGSTTALAGVGSDTSQDVMEGLSGALGGGTSIANYKATGTATINTRGTAACTFTRPNGSGNGLNALSAAIGGFAAFGSPGSLNGCVDFARSSSGSNPSTPPGGAVGQLTYVPFAVDSVTYAVLTVSNVPKNLNKSDLVDIYSRNTGNCLYLPLLPQAGSGTRNFFLGQLGFTSTTIGSTGGPGTCVKDVNAANTPIQEHDGRFLVSPDNLVPISVGQNIAQASGIISDIRGRSSLGSIDFTSAGVQGTSPYKLNVAFGFNRPLFNVIPTATVGASGTVNGSNATLINSTFVGSGSTVCSAAGQAIVNQYGFADIPAGYAGSGQCGDTSKKSTN